MKDQLNTKIWNEDFTINPLVRKKLLQIAKDFIEFVKIKNLKIVDIVLTGSMANFSWHSKSDIDLHIVVDLSNFGKHKNFIEEYLQTKKALWNYTHDIEIFGFEVEIYPEDKARGQKPTGIFSLAKNSWIVKPEKKDIKVDDSVIKSKYDDEVNTIMSFIDISKKKNFDYEKLLDKIHQYKEKLRKKRGAAIKENGEFSVENLVFKMLRNNGFLEKLNELQISIYDNAMTLERVQEYMMSESIKKGDKFILNRDVANLHGKQGDRFKVLIGESRNKFSIIRNLRIRKDYKIEKNILKEFLNKNFITKE